MDRKQLPQTPESPPVGNVIKAGLGILLFFIGGFLLWSLLFHLDAAAVAQGKLVVEYERKTIQHMEGGIIKTIYINEGSVVKANTPLIQLDDTQAKATLDLLQGQLYENLAAEARIFAELNNEKQVHYPASLKQLAQDPKVKKSLTDKTNYSLPVTKAMKAKAKF